MASKFEYSGIERIGIQVNNYNTNEIVYMNEGSFAWEGGLREGYGNNSIDGIPHSSLGYFGI
jgi:hypothetical protein